MREIDRIAQENGVEVERDPEWTLEGFREERRQRVSEVRAMALAAERIPRRLGGDATPAELALDKRRARRVAWAMTTAYRAWGGDPGELPAPDPAARSAGATVDWERFGEEWSRETDRARAVVAVQAVASGVRGEGNRAIHRLGEDRLAVTRAVAAI